MDPRYNRRRLFEERTAIVTGASGGIGRDVALTLAAEGARVALFARRTDLISMLAREIAGQGGMAIAVPCDVTQVEQVEAGVVRVHREFGAIDIVVNNAGVLSPAPFTEARLDDLRRMMEVNYFGTVNVISAVLPIMRAAASGNIVNVASIAGRRGAPTLSGYCASKFAVIGLTEALRAELFGSGIIASLVVPAATDTAMLDNPEWRRREWALGSFTMPPSWVTAGVIAAVVLGLAEVEVPPGVVTLEKIAALFPDLTATWFGVGSRLMDLMQTWMGRAR